MSTLGSPFLQKENLAVKQLNSLAMQIPHDTIESGILRALGNSIVSIGDKITQPVIKVTTPIVRTTSSVIFGGALAMNNQYPEVRPGLVRKFRNGSIIVFMVYESGLYGLKAISDNVKYERIKEFIQPQTIIEIENIPIPIHKCSSYETGISTFDLCSALVRCKSLYASRCRTN